MHRMHRGSSSDSFTKCIFQVSSDKKGSTTIAQIISRDQQEEQWKDVTSSMIKLCRAYWIDDNW